MQKGNVYFIGIGGIGMSALAKYFLHQGCTVSGYDKTKTALTTELETMGMHIHYTDDVSMLNADANIVIYTPAIPKQHSELTYYKTNGYTLLKRSEVLGLLTAQSTNICIAGTHGKTTVSTMVSHVLHHSGYGCNAFLGGISSNYNTNYLSSTNNVCVIEADEYDRSFLQLTPTIAAITTMDADHLDIYGTEQNMQDAFVQFTKQIQPNGLLVAKYQLPRYNELQATTIYSYHLSNTNANIFANNIATHNGTYTFDVCINGTESANFNLNVGGLHNIENALVAIAIANYLNISIELIKAAIASYKGVKRRFEYIIPPTTDSNIVLIDDYAHHPTELNALLSSVRSLFPTRKIVLLFQPHLYSRTRDFATQFSASLSKANEVVLLPIYPAREVEIEGVNSEMLLTLITSSIKVVVQKNELLNYLQSQIIPSKLPTVIVVAGAGDIDTLIQPIKELIQNNQ